MKVQQTRNRRPIVAFLFTAVAASLAGSIAAAHAAQPVTSFQRSFTLGGGKSTEFKVTLKGNLRYTAQASADGGHLHLRVLRYWQGDKKYDKSDSGGPAKHTFTSYEQDREYVFKVTNPQSHARHCQFSVSSGYGGGGGGPAPAQYVYDVDVSAERFIGHKSTESGGEEYKPTYSARLGSRQLFSKTEAFKGAKVGRPYSISGKGEVTVDDPNSEIVLVTSCMESDTGEPFGGDDDRLGNETKRLKISDYLGMNMIKVGNSNYTLEFEVTVRRRAK